MDPELEQTHLAWLARQLKDAFRRKKAARDRKPYRPHKRFDDNACWMRTAKLVARLNANPEDFIEAQFRLSKSTVFANTLHGATAEKRYKQFVALSSGLRADKLDDLQLDHAVTPGKADLAGRMANAMSVLQAAVGSTNPLLPEVKQYILSTPWMFDPLVIMLLAGQDADYQREFGKDARDMLMNSPYLRAAAEEMSLDLEHVYNVPTGEEH